MKLFSNDKTTCKDEIILTIITSIILILGILAIILRDMFGTFSTIVCTSGVVMLVFVMMMSVVIGYRFATNYTDNKKGNKWLF